MAVTIETIGHHDRNSRGAFFTGHFYFDGNTNDECPFNYGFMVWRPVLEGQDPSVYWAKIYDAPAQYTACANGAYDLEYDFFIDLNEAPQGVGLRYCAVVTYQEDGRKKGHQGNFFEYEYREPVCDLEISNITYTATKATSATAADGAITINTSSVEEIEYGINDSVFFPDSYQAQPVFTGLTPGFYTLFVRQKLFPACSARLEITLGFTDVVVEEPDTIPTVSEKVFFSLHPIEFVKDATPGQAVELNLYVETQHYGRDYQKVITRRRSAFANGKATFEVEGLLHTLLERNIQQPDFVNSMTGWVRQGILNFYCGLALVDPLTGVAGAEELTPLYTVLKGGLPPEERYRPDFFTSYLTTHKTFLTWHPAEITIGPDQPEFLYWLNMAGVNKYIVRRRLVINSETTVETNETVELPIEVSKFSLVCIQLLLNDLPANVRRVELLVVDEQGNPLTETRKFLVDRSFVRYQKYFLYENGFGVWETLRTTGPAEIGLDGKDEIGESGSGQLRVVGSEMSQKIKQSTGLHSYQEQERLQPFIYSWRRYEIRKPHLLPIILQKRTYAYEADNRKPTGYFFEYGYAFTPVTYAKFR